MKLGINTYTLMWSIGFRGVNPAFPNAMAAPANPLKLLDLLAIAHEQGLTLLQTGPNLPFESLSVADQEIFIEKAKEWGISLELGTRGLDLDHIERQAALAKRMGAGLIRTLPEINGQGITDGRLLPAVMRPLLPVLESYGLKLAIENGRIPAADLRDAMDEIANPHVGVVLDMVNSLAVSEGWKEVTRILAPHTMCLHYKDFTMRRAWHMMGFLCEGAPAGQGMVDTTWLLNELRASPYDYNVIVELWTPEQESVDATAEQERRWMLESLAYLRRYIKE